MDSDPANIVSSQLDFSGMQTSANFNSELRNSVPNTASTTNSSGRPIKGRDECRACGFDLASAPTSEFLPDRGMMRREKLAPGAMRQSIGMINRRDNTSR